MRELLKRFGALGLVLLATAVAIALSSDHWQWRAALVLLLPLSLLGLWDYFQQRHSLMRNFPLIARFRWLFEAARPYLRQYIVESDLTGRPFNREARALVYARAKDVIDSSPLGTDLDVYGPEYELMTHSINAVEVDDTDFRVRVGNAQCSRPYDASLFNISAMSFGALSGNAIEALNKGARAGNFYHDTGEGGVSIYHTRHGGDLVWEVGTGYFGCRDGSGNFDAAQFADQACADQVKMVEIKLSQGAKPGHGGVLPGSKVSAEIARARGVAEGQDCISPPFHRAFSTPVQLVEFAALLRERSGGKPVGIKLCVGHPWEVFAICKAMLETDIRLDYIVVDGAEGGTGAAPEELSDHVGMPLREGLMVVRNALVGTGLREEVKLATSGKVYSAFSIASNLALGADWCNSARAFMFALGCVMSKQCHTDKCPTGVATQNQRRQRGLVVEDKSQRVANYHRNTLRRLGELMGAAGLDDPAGLLPHHLYHRVGPNQVTTMDNIEEFLAHNQLLEEPEATPYAQWWSAAAADTFAPKRQTGPSKIGLHEH